MPKRLIKNGAKPVFSAEDILSEYEHLYGDLINMEKAKEPLSKIEYVNFRKPKNNTERTVEKTTETKACEKIKPASEEKTVVKKEVPMEASDDAKKVYSVLSEREMHIDDIVRQTDLRMNIVLASLTELELFGIVELVSGKKYKII